jgi:D-sedoheptulose 7-phosphate isomerase
VLLAATLARAKGIAVMGLTGRDGGKLAVSADRSIKVPAAATHRVQELHVPVYHAICAMLEAEFFRRNQACNQL